MLIKCNGHLSLFILFFLNESPTVKKRELKQGIRASSSYQISNNAQTQSQSKRERKIHKRWLKVHSISLAKAAVTTLENS